MVTAVVVVAEVKAVVVKANVSELVGPTLTIDTPSEDEKPLPAGSELPNCWKPLYVCAPSGWPCPLLSHGPLHASLSTAF